MLVARIKKAIKKSKCSLNGDNRKLPILVLKFLNISATFVMSKKRGFNKILSLEKIEAK